MKFVTILTIFLSFWSWFTRTADENQLKSDAESSYAMKKYDISIVKYSVLINSYKNTDERVRLNLAHSYFNLNDSINAEFHYLKLSKSHNLRINSISNNQLGFILASHKEYRQALKHFRQALKSDPANEIARYNYELIKKMIEEKEKVNSSEKDKNKKKNKSGQPEQIDNDDSPSGGKGKPGDHDEKGKAGQSRQSVEDNNGDNEKSKGEGEKNRIRDRGNNELENNELMPDEKGMRKRDALISQRLKLINMSEDKAMMILEAMKNSEIQYLQQIKKKGNPKYDKDKPDW
jgi:Ca-activated chloride channel homolog